MQPYRLLLCLALLALFVASPPVWATSQASQVKAGEGRFLHLLDNPEQAKHRSNWLKLEKTLLKGYNTQPEGRHAAKALYFLGRTYEELGKRSYLKDDFRQAVQYFEKGVREFPDSSWSRRGKLHKAKVRLNHLQQQDQAYLDLFTIVDEYPAGEVRDRAQDLLRDLERDQMSRHELSEEIDVPEPEAAPPSMSRLEGIRHWGQEGYSRVVLDMEEEASYNSFVLEPNPVAEKPLRLVIDLQETWVPDNVKRSLELDGEPLQRVRTGQYRESTSRVVFDVDELQEYEVFTLKDPDRLVVDLHGSGSNIAQGSEGAPEETQELPIHLGEDSSRENLVQQLGLDIETVMLDPGHGGSDPGAVVEGVMEKDIALRMAKILGETLEEQGFKVKYTRKEDKYVSLEERTAIANSQNADLFISLHTNAHDNHNVQGVEVYNLNLASSQEAAEVAARENAVSRKQISDLELILTDLMLESKIEESAKLGDKVLQKSIQYCRQFYELKSNGLRQAPFYVLMGAQMPAILVEIGYLTHPEDRRRMQEYAYLKRLAWGITQGVKAYEEEVTQYAEN